MVISGIKSGITKMHGLSTLEPKITDIGIGTKKQKPWRCLVQKMFKGVVWYLYLNVGSCLAKCINVNEVRCMA